jgi:hypothetical protein
MKTSLETLAATSPKLAFRSYRESAEKIKTLETALGLPAGKPIYNVRAAAVRIAELETMLAAKQSAAPAAVPVVAAPVVETFGRERFCAAAKVTTNGVAVKMQRHPAAVATGQKPEAKGRARFSSGVVIKQ